MRYILDKYIHVFANYYIVLVKYSPTKHCIEPGSMFARCMHIHLHASIYQQPSSSVFRYTCELAGLHE